MSNRNPYCCSPPAPSQSMGIHEKQSKPLKNDENIGKLMETCATQWKSLQIIENLWKSKKTYRNQCKQMRNPPKAVKSNKNLWRSMKTTENLWTPNEKQSHNFARILLDLSLVFPSFVCISMVYGQPEGWPYSMEKHTKLRKTKERSSETHAKLSDLYCFTLGIYWFSFIFIDFQRFSSLFIAFAGSRIPLHWFQWFFLDFQGFSMIFKDLHWVV